ncbi:MAG: 2-phosphosulfolactate phosphatase [Ignavibacteriaceae bacterium]|jgi:2-phosphosulfolactate phosphatase|nr:2-phosphosulfolactate phosphatase [Ignavibacteriaceae bacterium]
MKINVLFTHNIVDEFYFNEKTTVIIDVLRATTVINTALYNGAKEIIPVSSVDFAVKVSGSVFGGVTLLCGERNTKKIEGFDLGNSPFEYSPEVVNNKSIVLFTTNGSKAIVKAKYSENVVTCCFNNLDATKNYLLDSNKDIEVVCSGNNGHFSLEDLVCAGKLVTGIAELIDDVVLSDSATVSMAVAKSYGKNLKKLLQTTEHGKVLKENGYEADLDYCSKLNSVPIVTQFSSGVIKRLN